MYACMYVCMYNGSVINTDYLVRTTSNEWRSGHASPRLTKQIK